MICGRKRKECLLALEVEVSSDTLWPHQALKLYPPYNAKMCKSVETKVGYVQGETLLRSIVKNF